MVRGCGFVARELPSVCDIWNEANEREVYATVRNVGQQTFYQRGQLWVTPKTSELDLEKDKVFESLLTWLNQQVE